MSSRPSHETRPTPASQTSQPGIERLTQEFTTRLLLAMEHNALDRGRAIIASLASTVSADRATDADLPRRPELVDTLTRQLLRALERPIQQRTRELWRAEVVAQKAFTRAQARRGSGDAARGRASADKRPRRTRAKLRVVAPPDPEQIRRDAENARLRALLRPANDFEAAPAATSPIVQPQRQASPGDELRSLEQEIQNAVPSLGTLGPERCGAQIAVWAGQVRELRDRLPAQVAATMRPAFRIFLEHLTELRAAMDAHLVDALEPTWSAPDWAAYVEVNRARVQGRAPLVSPAKLEQHHRAMLRALLEPHRRNVPQQAMAVISAAAEVLSTDDGQVRSAVRRHNSTRQRQRPPSPSTVTSLAPTPTPAPAATSPADASTDAPASGTTPDTIDKEPAKDGEFDSPWTD
jgi:hypothetical protein